ncbi:MAG: ATP-binding cassette domain-containing protein, partial [Ilumatobacteraceae bacterium]
MTTTTMDDAAPFTSPSTGSTAGSPSARAGSQGSQVSIQGVHKVFRRRGQTVEALRSVDLDIERGEFISLLGPSGCGKSTLLRVIGGLTGPDAGSVDIGGVSPTEARRSKQFGLVPQTPALVPWATVEKNV